jgi:hypothetical protein
MAWRLYTSKMSQQTTQCLARTWEANRPRFPPPSMRRPPLLTVMAIGASLYVCTAASVRCRVLPILLLSTTTSKQQQLTSNLQQEEETCRDVVASAPSLGLNAPSTMNDDSPISSSAALEGLQQPQQLPRGVRETVSGAALLTPMCKP